MRKTLCTLFVCLAASSTVLLADDDDPQQPPAAPPAAPAPAPAAAPAPPTWSVGPIDFSGLVDGYYSFNTNHPASGFNGGLNNPFYENFDVRANQFSLNMAKLSMSHTADPVGFQVYL